MHQKTYKRVLVVEDVKSISNFICRQIQNKLGLETIPAASYQETREILERETDFFTALLDLNLPDAPEGEIVDFVISKDIPSIVLTATFDEKVRERIQRKNVVDYMIKEGFRSLRQINWLIRRLYRNQFIKILVADDTRSYRNYYKSLLHTHKYEVIEAENGKRALEILNSTPDIKLVITDYNMPEMDGFELVSRIRESHEKNEIAIIGISAQGSGMLSAKFLKSGANDFLKKPFEKEEFYARVTQNVEMLEYIDELKNSAIRDPLTKLFNRRYFFDAGEKMFNQMKRAGQPPAIAMLDIDFFKSVNDNYGHHAGDAVLKNISATLVNNFGKPHIVARFGGEEFCILVCGVEGGEITGLFETLRRTVEESEVRYEKDAIRVTLSAGVCVMPHQSMEQMINRADELLYQAKREGRNRVVGEVGRDIAVHLPE